MIPLFCFSMLLKNYLVIFECVLVQVTLPRSCWRVIWVELGVVGRGGGGLRTLNGGEVGRMQMSSQFKWGCFFIHEGLIESWCGGDEWNMHGAAVLYPPPAGPMINFSSVVCGLVTLQRRATHDPPKWIWCCVTAQCQSTNWRLTQLKLQRMFHRNRTLSTSSTLILPTSGPFKDQSVFTDHTH